MNPYLTEDNQPTKTLEYTLDYYGVILDEFKAITDEQITVMVKRFSDVLNDGRVSKSSGGSGVASQYTDNQSHGKYLQGIRAHAGGLGDSGSFSRYFDLDKWWEERIKLLPASVQKTFPFLIVPKASKSEKNKGCEGLEAKPIGDTESYVSNRKCLKCGLTKYSQPHCQCKEPEFVVTEGGKHYNYHPTVKPIKLMSYLITLGSREGDIVLDPFLGSGTTALACQMLNRECIGIEIDKSYYEIAVKRCSREVLI